MKLGEAIYKASQAAEGGEDGGVEGVDGQKEEVIDADFQEVDDEKKKG